MKHSGNEATCELICHPLTPVSGIDEISVTYEWLNSSRLWLRYHADGLIEDISIPDSVEPQRCDNLWQATCFEMFIKETGHDRYLEFNFSPSRRWAVYQFTGYRDGMSNLSLLNEPEIYMDYSDTHFALEVTLDLPDIWGSAPLEAGFSAVVAEQSGEKSYWALTHAPGQPDFHHGDCFSHKLRSGTST